ncbi:D-alanyl-D-alanine carboxypeptidase family protein [Cellulomonas biazotea]|uniref:D-alanyl-D-alanine carboxypeptidase family protein n=2 Tax=Cellulomonas biazotea TaxID=1709 RepID=UPI0035EF1E8C
MGPERTEPTPAAPATRRSRREAERRAAAQSSGTSSAVLTPPGVPIAPASRTSVTSGPTVPTWSQPRTTGPAAPSPAVRSSLPAPGARTSQPGPVARATSTPGSWGSPAPAARPVSSSRSTLPAPGAKSASPAPAAHGTMPAPTVRSTPAPAPAPAAPAPAAPAPAAPAPVVSTPAGPVAAAPRTTAAPAPRPTPTVESASGGGWPSWRPTGAPASTTAAAAPAVTETAVMAPLPLDDDVEDAPAPRAAEAAPARTPVEPTPRSSRSTSTRPAGRRAARMPRMAVRLGVLGALAGVTVVIPTVSQGALDGVALPGMDATLAEAALPDTVTALTATSLSILPPSSLISADGALAARAAGASASRSEERSALAGCDGSARPAGGNGLLKTDDLCTLWDAHTQLRADAAVSLAEFNQAFVARFGADLCLSSGYRSLAQQRAVKAQKGGLAAAPGKSNHGWGLAIDLCQNQTSGTKWAWITENGPAFGWENPAWAKRGGSGPYEPWHWEYSKGVKEDGEYYDG